VLEDTLIHSHSHANTHTHTHAHTHSQIIDQQNTTTNDLNDNYVLSDGKLSSIQSTLVSHGTDLATLISGVTQNGLDIALADAVIAAINLKTIDTNNDVASLTTTTNSIATVSGTINTKVTALQTTADTVEFTTNQNLLKLTETLALSLDLNETLYLVRDERRQTAQIVTHLQQRNELHFRELNNTVIENFLNRTRRVDPLLDEINGTVWKTLAEMRASSGSNVAVLNAINADTVAIIATQLTHTSSLATITSAVDTVESTQAAHTTSLSNIYTDTQALLSTQATQGTLQTDIKTVVDDNKVHIALTESKAGDNNVLLGGINTQVNQIWTDTGGLVTDLGVLQGKVDTIQSAGVACTNLGTGTAGYRVVYLGPTVATYFGYGGDAHRGFKDICEVDFPGQGAHPCTHNDIMTAGAEISSFSGWVIDGMEMDFMAFHDGSSGTVPVVSYCTRTKGGNFDRTFTDAENFACSTTNVPFWTRYPNCGDWVMKNPDDAAIAANYRGAFYVGTTGHYQMVGCQNNYNFPCCIYDGSA
jgi:hypothetical protein